MPDDSLARRLAHSCPGIYVPWPVPAAEFDAPTVGHRRPPRLRSSGASRPRWRPHLGGGRRARRSGPGQRHRRPLDAHARRDPAGQRPHPVQRHRGVARRDRRRVRRPPRRPVRPRDGLQRGDRDGAGMALEAHARPAGAGEHAGGAGVARRTARRPRTHRRGARRPVRGRCRRPGRRRCRGGRDRRDVRRRVAAHRRGRRRGQVRRRSADVGQLRRGRSGSGPRHGGRRRRLRRTPGERGPALPPATLRAGPWHRPHPAGRHVARRAGGGVAVPVALGGRARVVARFARGVGRRGRGPGAAGPRAAAQPGPGGGGDPARPQPGARATAGGGRNARPGHRPRHRQDGNPHHRRRLARRRPPADAGIAGRRAGRQRAGVGGRRRRAPERHDGRHRRRLPGRAGLDGGRAHPVRLGTQVHRRLVRR